MLETTVRCEVAIPGDVKLEGEQLLDVFAEYFNQGARVYTEFGRGLRESIGILSVVDLIGGKLHASVRLDPTTKAGRNLIERIGASSRKVYVTASATFRGDRVDMVLLETEKAPQQQ